MNAIAAPWEASNPTAAMSPDGVVLGPYADGSAAGASLRYHGLDGQPLSAVTQLAYCARYTSDDSVAEGSDIYCRVFTQDASSAPHDAIFTPGSQPYTGLGAGPVQEHVATAGTWRYDDDSGTGGESFASLVTAHGTDTITKIVWTLGYTAGTNLAGLLRWVQVNGSTFAFGGPAPTGVQVAPASIPTATTPNGRPE